MILFFTRIHLPSDINSTLSAVGSMIGPASMIVTGMLFAGMNLKKIFTNKRVYFVSFLRLVIVPVIALILIKCSQLSTFSSNGNKLMLIVFLAIITPSASTVTQMCQVYGNDSQYASAINVVINSVCYCIHAGNGYTVSDDRLTKQSYRKQLFTGQ